MEKCFCLGLALGMMAGAVLAVNSVAVRKLVAKGQRQVKQEVEKMTDGENENPFKEKTDKE